MTMLPVTEDEVQKLQPILQKFGFEVPAIKITVYKNRGNRWKDIILWCKDRRGVCKIEPMFITNYNLDLIQMEDIKINIKPKTVSSDF